MQEDGKKDVFNSLVEVEVQTIQNVLHLLLLVYENSQLENLGTTSIYTKDVMLRMY